MRLAAASLALISALNIVGQLPVQFDGPTNQWFVADTYPQGGLDDPFFIRTTTLRYFFGGDSLMGGDSWGKVFSQGTTEPPTPPDLRGLVRQEGNVVLFMDEQNVVDTLYDFRLQVGDSMRYVSYVYDTYLPVVGVDSIFILDAYHKVIRFGEYVLTLEDLLSDTWIEGIGSVHGPLAPRLPNTLGFNYGFPDSTRTTCFLQDEQVVWNHSGYPDCIVNIILGVSEPVSAPALTLHPNPGSTFQLTGLGQRPALLSLLDVQGRAVHEGLLVTEHSMVDIPGLHAGTYLVQLQFSDGRREVLRWTKE